MSNAIDESFRRLGPAAVIARRLTRDITIRGMHIPKGQQVYMGASRDRGVHNAPIEYAPSISST